MWLDGHHAEVVEADTEPEWVYVSERVPDEELFVSLLNDNQRKAWDGPWGPWFGYGDNWECKKIPVRGSDGGLWEIVFARDKCAGPNLRAILYDHNSRQRCFHAVTDRKRVNSAGVNDSRPYVAAIAFMTQLQSNEAWVRSRAG